MNLARSETPNQPAGGREKLRGGPNNHLPQPSFGRLDRDPLSDKPRVLRSVALQQNCCWFMAYVS